MKLLTSLICLLALNLAYAAPSLINGKPVGDMFKGVGMFNYSCTITKVGPKQFITAAHCVGKSLSTLRLSFGSVRATVRVTTMHVHESWKKDCFKMRCSGKEVGGPNMTPGRSDVAFINVNKETPNIPIIEINYNPLSVGTEVAMVGGGCTKGIKPGGPGKMRYAITNLVSFKSLMHEKSLYKKIAETTGRSNWITPGYLVSNKNASLCPGDSGGPLLSKNAKGIWEIVGIAADYTFDGPYTDGALTMTNIHTRLDDNSFHGVGAWIRSVWEN